MNDAIKPPFTVKIFNSDGTLDATGGDASDPVTLSLTSGGSLGGSIVASAVGGIATFDDISVPTAGSYTLTAIVDSNASSATITPATSVSFDVTAGNPDTITPTLPRLNVPTTGVAGTNVNGNATVALTNTSDTTSTGKQTVAVNLMATGETAAVLPALAGSLTAADTSSGLIPIGSSVTKNISLKPGKSTKLNLPIKTLPDVAAGIYSFVVTVTDANGNCSQVISTQTITIAAASVALTEITPTVKLPASLVSGQLVKGGSISFLISNGGNVLSKGVTTIDVAASKTAGVAGTNIATLSKVLKIAPGKSVKIKVPIKSLPALAVGDYFLVVQVTDPFTDGVSTVSSADTFAVAGG